MDFDEEQKKLKEIMERTAYFKLYGEVLGKEHENILSAEDLGNFWKAFMGGDHAKAAELTNQPLEKIVEFGKAIEEFDKELDAYQKPYEEKWKSYQSEEEMPEFKKKKQLKKKIAIVQFSSEMCMPCKVMKPIFYELWQEYKGKVDFYHTTNQRKIKKYKIQGVPTFKIFDNGKEVSEIMGGCNKGVIREKLDAYLK